MAKKPKQPLSHKSRLPYDFVTIGDCIPLDISPPERAALQKALGKKPSNTFLVAYALGLNSYIANFARLGYASPAKVQGRLKDVLKHGRGLLEALQCLEDTDRCYIDKFYTQRVFSRQDAAGEHKLAERLCLFLADVQSAVNKLGAVQKKGTMPEFPAQRLALTIAQVLYLESNKFPPLTRGGVFDRVVRCALDVCDSRLLRVRYHGQARSDAMALMRIARDNFDLEEARQFGRVLNHFTTSKPQS